LLERPFGDIGEAGNDPVRIDLVEFGADLRNKAFQHRRLQAGEKNMSAAHFLDTELQGGQVPAFLDGVEDVVREFLN
jgi:hypothetical protein